ncbi:hypothetical protein Tco_1175495 [Tanacetum coccineum]
MVHPGRPRAPLGRSRVRTMLGALFVLSTSADDVADTSASGPTPADVAADVVRCMSTRSTSTDLVPPFFDPESVIRNRRRNLDDPSLLLDFKEIHMANNNNNVQGPPPAGPNIPAPDIYPMEELLQAPTDGVGDAIVVPPFLLVNLNQFKDLLNKCPHHGFSLLHQIDTFYNGLNQSDQDSLNSAAGGNFLTRNTQEALTIIENKSKVRTSRNKPQALSASDSSSQNDAITILSKQVDALSKQISSMNKPDHAVQEGCETCGGPHALLVPLEWILNSLACVRFSYAR